MLQKNRRISFWKQEKCIIHSLLSLTFLKVLLPSFRPCNNRYTRNNRTPRAAFFAQMSRIQQIRTIVTTLLLIITTTKNIFVHWNTYLSHFLKQARKNAPSILIVYLVSHFRPQTLFLSTSEPKGIIEWEIVEDEGMSVRTTAQEKEEGREQLNRLKADRSCNKTKDN